MPEKQTATTAETIYPDSHDIEVQNGTVNYSLIGEANPDKHPIIWVSGAEQSRLNPLDAAKLLAKEGGRQVLIYEQPVYNKDIPDAYKKDPKHAIDFLAEAVLAASEDAGLVGEGKVADAVAHSMGAIVLERMKQLAKERGITSLEQGAGSQIVLIAPTGSNSRENLLKIGGRWIPYSVKGIIEGKTLDPTGQKGKALQDNMKADPAKFWGEVKAMAKHRINYPDFGEARVLIYPEDRMFPENGPARRYRARGPMKKPVGRGFINHAILKEYPLSFATPIGSDTVATKGLRRWATKAALSSDKRREYVKSHRGSGHNHPTDYPEQTVHSILEYLNPAQPK